MALVVVVDYGMGNLRSVEKALGHVGTSDVIKVSGDPADIAKADKIVFPGQGAMPDCMRELESRKLIEPIRIASAKKPFLGICIGLQLLFECSAEGGVDGLGLISGEVRKFAPNKLDEGGSKFKVPHMGWNTVDICHPHPIFEGIDSDEYFYFVHSYFVEPLKSQVVIGKTAYINGFASAVASKNIVAIQFHSEKSQQSRLRMLSNFLSCNCHLSG